VGLCPLCFLRDDTPRHWATCPATTGLAPALYPADAEYPSPLDLLPSSTLRTSLTLDATFLLTFSPQVIVMARFLTATRRNCKALPPPRRTPPEGLPGSLFRDWDPATLWTWDKASQVFSERGITLIDSGAANGDCLFGSIGARLGFQSPATLAPALRQTAAEFLSDSIHGPDLVDLHKGTFPIGGRRNASTNARFHADAMAVPLSTCSRAGALVLASIFKVTFRVMEFPDKGPPSMAWAPGPPSPTLPDFGCLVLVEDHWGYLERGPLKSARVQASPLVPALARPPSPTLHVRDLLRMEKEREKVRAADAAALARDLRRTEALNEALLASERAKRVERRASATTSLAASRLAQATSLAARRLEVAATRTAETAARAARVSLRNNQPPLVPTLSESESEDPVLDSSGSDSSSKGRSASQRSVSEGASSSL
jgi:hypothetical protein